VIALVRDRLFGPVIFGMNGLYLFRGGCQRQKLLLSSVGCLVTGPTSQTAAL
jgi:hypothetical protein